MRILRLSLLIPALLTFSGVFAGVSDLDVAKKALRDNLWEIARIRASKAEGEDSRIIILESYAREGKWKEILDSIASWGSPPGDVYVFYETLAKAKTDGSSDIAGVLEKCGFSNPAYAKSLACTAVQTALDASDAALAKRIAEKYSLDS